MANKCRISKVGIKFRNFSFGRKGKECEAILRAVWNELAVCRRQRNIYITWLDAATTVTLRVVAAFSRRQQTL